MDKIKDKLFKVLDNCETKQLAYIFENYMKSKGYRKVDRRRKDNTNTYSIHGECCNWNRVECYFHKEFKGYNNDCDLDVTLRKRAGYYLIVGDKDEVAFERSFNDVVHYNEELLRELYERHKELFEELFKLVS